MINWEEPRNTLEESLALERYLAEAQAVGIDENDAYAMLHTVTDEGEYTTVEGILAESKARLIARVPSGTLEQAWARMATSDYQPEPEFFDFEEVPQPGAIILTRIQGPVGWLVWALQAINGDLSKWTHAMIMLDDGNVWECQPGGSVFTKWSKYENRKFAVVKYRQRNKTMDGTGIHELEPLNLTPEERADVVQAARDFGLGVGYGWTTYLYLAAYRIGIRPRWLKARVQNAEHLICSQGVDEVYNLADLHLFHDGRMPYDVTPGDLGRLT